MTLLELWDRDVPRIRTLIGGSIDFKDIRRALAIAQAVDEASKFPEETVIDVVGSAMVEAIKERADELLAERKP